MNWILTEEGWTDGETLVPVPPVPDYFKEKWERHTQGLLNSDDCPLKDNGEPDWSTIEFQAAKRSFYGYRFRPRDKQMEVMGWIGRFIADQAQRRNKPSPMKYASRTVLNAAGQVMDESVYAGRSLITELHEYYCMNEQQRQKQLEKRWKRTWAWER